MSPVIIFRRNALKGTAKAPAVDLLRLNTLRGTKAAFLTPKRYDEHPVLFIWEFPPPPPPPGEIDFLRPIPNVVLLPCRTQMNLAWQWHDDGTAAVSNVEQIQSRQIHKTKQTIHPA